MDLEVKTRLDDVDLREVQIIPLGIGYDVEIVYSKEISDVSELSPKRILGIDIGVRNIVTIGNNISEKGIAVKGGVLKSINQYFNKELSRLRSISDRQRKNRENTKRINRLYLTRNRKIKDIMHKLSKAVIEYAMNNRIDTIVIGHNNGWKQSVDIGKENNQNFVQIPFNMLIQQIKYKAEEKGINVMIQ
ncbi:IS200/IS605 family accessory protein TnpB-related protein, partial [Thermoplasma sp. Kam2015]|uniref:IS200/IS605 family accessory protein TnpB-related protein n=1 Tax=Thermoplasma sp. Kam2015 TaxID=2094122 RepID=UPI00191C88B0